MFRNKTVTTVTTWVKCDTCGAEKEIGNNLNWDGRMNGCLASGYTFREEDGKFKNYCKKCK